MKPVFDDAVYFIGLVNPDDQYHRQVVAVSMSPPGPLQRARVEAIPKACHSERSEESLIISVGERIGK
jgi:hypothetical protein